MGGNALKNVAIRRYKRDEYLVLEREVLDKLTALFNPRAIAPIEAYATKESFGDMDILILSDDLPNDWHLAVADVLMSKQVEKNGNVCSFEHREFQIDVIATPLAEFNTSRHYFAFNDLGNLLGRIAHSMGLKLGHDGLSYNWRVETYQFRNVVVSTDWDQILAVLGYNPEVYRAGFQTLESIFEFVVSGTFFNPEIYLLHNRNNASRVRDAKRKSYTEFLAYNEKHKDMLFHYPRKEHKADWLPYLFTTIPGFRETYETVQAEWDDAIRFKALFNGDVVTQATGLKGKELGAFMKWIKDNTEGLQAHVLAMNPQVIPAWIEHRYKAFKEQQS
jgi:hypothetical protein